jgi:dTDP-4-dehydrorhamnose reductase
MARILVTGGSGQVGGALAALDWPEGIEIDAPGRAELDLSSDDSIAAWFAARHYDAVVNCAAYTAVDQAEDQVGAAFLANAQGPAWIAHAARAQGAALLHVSTDYVFDGTFGGYYDEAQPTAPLGVYGASKRAGELAVLSGNPRTLVLRTAWVVSPGGKNFVRTMLRVAAGNDSVRVVDDQRGCPTAAADIALALRTIVLRMLGDPAAPTGIYHFVNGGEASWCGFAAEIFRLSAAAGGPTATAVPITSGEFPTKVERPKNSRLACDKIARDYGIAPRLWQDAVADVVASILQTGDRN